MDVCMGWSMPGAGHDIGDTALVTYHVQCDKGPLGCGDMGIYLTFRTSET